MCGRFFVEQSWQEYQDMLRLLPAVPTDRPIARRSDIRPTQDIAIIDRDQSLRAARWGLIAPWQQELGGKPIINARGETVAEKPLFREAFAGQNGGRRVLVPADGYYEWAEIEGRNQPHRVTLADGNPLLFAAIAWFHPTFGGVSCAIITLAADAAIATVHQRMPVVLEPDVWRAWLDPDTGVAQALALLQRNRGAELRALPCAPPSGTAVAKPSAPALPADLFGG